jgi:hypothetical protein
MGTQHGSKLRLATFALAPLRAAAAILAVLGSV